MKGTKGILASLLRRASIGSSVECRISHLRRSCEPLRTPSPRSSHSGNSRKFGNYSEPRRWEWSFAAKVFFASYA